MSRILITILLLVSCSYIKVGNKPIPHRFSSRENYSTIAKFCQIINKRFKKYNWNRIICNPRTWDWEPEFTTPKGYPLLYKEFVVGKPKTTTLVLCGVHGDELPVMYQCVHMVRDILFDHSKAYQDQRIVIAPMINPDGFLSKKPTRQNGKGVDINRNFPTKDFDAQALIQWRRKTGSSIRKYPGKIAASEIETRFQINLIDRFHPDKIISMHSPYGWLDVDSPNRIITGDEPDGYTFREFLLKSKSVAKVMSKKSNNYRVINFRVYPGSLGNYAAKERGIPTYTLELPTSGAHKAHEYWLTFRTAYRAAVQFEIRRPK